MASGWNLWVWLECIGVVIIIITLPYSYSTCISSFLAATSHFFVHLKKCFFVLVIIIQCANSTITTFWRARGINNNIPVYTQKWNGMVSERSSGNEAACTATALH